VTAEPFTVVAHQPSIGQGATGRGVSSSPESAELVELVPVPGDGGIVMCQNCCLEPPGSACEEQSLSTMVTPSSVDTKIVGWTRRT
jgi:hypothetical protein